MNTDDIKLFHRIVDTGSLVDTAELLQQPKSTLSRRIKAMEEELKVKLFHRQNRCLILTAAGSSFYNNSQKIIEDFNSAVTEITDKQTDISGKVRIQMFPMQDNTPITDIVFAFMEANPNIKVDIITSTEPLDINGNNFDLALWVQMISEDQDMVSRTVAYSNMYYFASPEFLATHGTPQSPNEIDQYDCILYQLNLDTPYNQLPVDSDLLNEIKVAGSFCTNNVDIGKKATIAGKGLGFLPIEWCQSELSSGKLVRLFGPEPVYRSALNLVYPPRRFVSLAAQRFIDFTMDEINKNGPIDITSD